MATDNRARSQQARPPQQPPQQAEPHWRDLHRRKNSAYLFSEDIGPAGTAVDVEIVDSGDCEVQGQDGNTPMPFIAFRGKRKRLGVSRTNCKILETICGTGNHWKWRGWITLVVIRAAYNDQKTKARLEQDRILVAPQRPRGKVAGPPEQPSERAAAEPVADDQGAPPLTADEQAEIAAAEREAGR